MKLPERAPVKAEVFALAGRLDATVQGLHQMADGQTHAAGSVLLRAGQVTTTVTKAGIPATAVPILQAGSGTWTSTVMRVTSVAAGSFVITHSNEAAADRLVHWFAPVPA